jgi:hypothetical protein
MGKSDSRTDQVVNGMPPVQQEIARVLREVIRKAAPGLVETIKWNNVCYTGDGNVCSIIAHAGHVNLQFFRGAELDDPEGLLEGTGKGMRHVKVRSVEEIGKKAIAALVRAAASLPASPRTR